MDSSISFIVGYSFHLTFIQLDIWDLPKIVKIPAGKTFFINLFYMEEITISNGLFLLKPGEK